ncbi:hypothetical protein ACFX2F_017312 [Malus domestica]
MARKKSFLGFIPLPDSFPFPLLQEPAGLLVGLRDLLLRILGLQSLQFRVVVVGNPQKREAVAEQIDRGHGVLDNGPRKGDQEPIFHHSGNIHRQRRGLSDEQEHGEIQSKCADRIGPKNHEIEMEARGIAQNRVLDEDPGDEEESQTARCDVVERCYGVEGNAFGCEEDLDQDKAGGLECDCAELEHDAPGVESGLSVGGDGDADGNGDHVDHGVSLEGLLFEGDANGVDRDGHEGLEHLDEGDGEVDVGGVGEPEGEGVESADGDDGGEVEVAGHGDGLDEAEDADEEEGQGGAEGHVDHGEGDGEGPVVHLLVEDVFVVDDDGEGEEDPDGDVGVGEEDLFYHPLAQGATFAHFGGGFSPVVTVAMAVVGEKGREVRRRRSRRKKSDSK